MKNSNDTIGNRNNDLPAWSAFPQPTAPVRALSSITVVVVVVEVVVAVVVVVVVVVIVLVAVVIN